MVLQYIMWTEKGHTYLSISWGKTVKERLNLRFILNKIFGKECWSMCWIKKDLLDAGAAQQKKAPLPSKTHSRLVARSRDDVREKRLEPSTFGLERADGWIDKQRVWLKRWNRKRKKNHVLVYEIK